MLLALPACLLFWWYLAQDYLLTLLRFATEYALLGLMPETVLGILAQDRVWLIKTALSPIDSPMNLLGIPISTHRLTISYPLLWALLLATPSSATTGKLSRLIKGTLLLFPVTLLMALLLIQFKLALHINHIPILTEVPQGAYLLVLPYSDYHYYLMAVGRQLSLLVLPTLAPVIIWLVLQRKFIKALLLEGLFSRAQQTIVPQKEHKFSGD